MFLYIRVFYVAWGIFIKRTKLQSNYQTNIYLFKVNNRNSRKRCEICSKLKIKTPEQFC